MCTLVPRRSRSVCRRHRFLCYSHRSKSKSLLSETTGTRLDRTHQSAHSAADHRTGVSSQSWAILRCQYIILHFHARSSTRSRLTFTQEYRTARINSTLVTVTDGCGLKQYYVVSLLTSSKMSSNDSDHALLSCTI
jgi:hypothetical protein